MAADAWVVTLDVIGCSCWVLSERGHPFVERAERQARRRPTSRTQFNVQAAMLLPMEIASAKFSAQAKPRRMEADKGSRVFGVWVVVEVPSKDRQLV